MKSLHSLQYPRALQAQSPCKILATSCLQERRNKCFSGSRVSRNASRRHCEGVQIAPRRDSEHSEVSPGRFSGRARSREALFPTCSQARCRKDFVRTLCLQRTRISQGVQGLHPRRRNKLLAKNVPSSQVEPQLQLSKDRLTCCRELHCFPERSPHFDAW